MNQSFVWVFTKPNQDDITMLPEAPERTRHKYDFLEIVDNIYFYISKLSRFQIKKVLKW